MKTAIFKCVAVVCLVLGAMQAACKKRSEPSDLERGTAYFQAGIFDQAIVAWSLHLRRNPTDAAVFARRGEARKAVGDIAGALGDFECALNLMPDLVEVHMQRGTLRKMLGDLKGATEDFDSAIELDPTNSHAFYYRANIRTSTGDLDGAIADYTCAMQFEPSGLNQFNRGIAYYLRKDWEKAKRDFDTAARAKDPQPYGWFYSYVVQVRLGQAEQARSELRAHVQDIRESRSGDWFPALAGFLLGEIDEATLLAAAANGAKAREQRCEASYFAGMARLFAGQRTEAAECFRQSLATGRTNFAEYAFAKAELEVLEEKSEPPQPVLPAPLRGRVSAVSKRSFSLRESETGAIRSVAISRDTKVTRNGKRVSFQRIEPAMDVQVLVDANGTARSIDATARK
jgi:lipoprotein NlpI